MALSGGGALCASVAASVRLYVCHRQILDEIASAVADEDFEKCVELRAVKKKLETGECFSLVFLLSSFEWQRCAPCGRAPRALWMLVGAAVRRINLRLCRRQTARTHTRVARTRAATCRAEIRNSQRFVWERGGRQGGA